MKKNVLAILLALCMILALLAGCGGQGTQNDEPADEKRVDLWLEAYPYVDAMLTITDAEETYETGSFGTEAVPGVTVGDVLADCGITAVEPYLEGDTFEGWLEFEIVVTTDEDGWEEYSYILTSESPMTFEELLKQVVPDHEVSYTAKWAGIPVEEYYPADEFGDWGEIGFSGAFSLSANGGMMHFWENEESQYEVSSYTYWLEEGQALNDVMGVDGWASLTGIEKDGAEFAGWTLYQTDNFYWTAEPSGEEGTESFLFNPDWEDGKYIVLENPVVIRELSSTEELCGITCEAGNYVAVANWK